MFNDYENSSGDASPNPNPDVNDGRDNYSDDSTVDKNVDDNNDIGENNNCTADDVCDCIYCKWSERIGLNDICLCRCII